MVNKGRYRHFSVRVPSDVHRRLRIAAAVEDLSTSEVVRRVLSQWARKDVEANAALVARPLDSGELSGGAGGER